MVSLWSQTHSLVWNSINTRTFANESFFVLPPNTFSIRVLYTPSLPGLVGCLQRAGPQARPEFPWQCHRCYATEEEWAVEAQTKKENEMQVTFTPKMVCNFPICHFHVHCKQSKCFEAEGIEGDIAESTCKKKKASSTHLQATKSGMREQVRN